MSSRYLLKMRTTIDLDAATLHAAKSEARDSGKTLSEFVSDAVRQHLAALAPSEAEPGFELLVRGRKGGRFPTFNEIAELEAVEDLGPLAAPRRGRRAAS